MEPTLSEQAELRIQKVAELRALGIDPYPSTPFPVSHTIASIQDGYQKNPQDRPQVLLAGRLMSRRIMGTLSFGELQDHSGRLQLALVRDTLCPGEDKFSYNQFFKKLLDLGDIIGIKGYPFTTKSGALAIKVEALTLLSKAIQPLPIVKAVAKEKKTFYSFTDPEQRYRQRYLDLLLNPKVSKIFTQRTNLIKTIRHYFDQQGYLEVETPILQPLYGGASARPFKTHHHALNTPLYLRISNELYLKRLMIGGYPGVYEFAKDFRNEGMSRFHNPEFTQVEVYVAFQGYRWMMQQVEILLQKIAFALHQTTKIKVGQQMVDFAQPFARFTLLEAIQHFTGHDLSSASLEKVRWAAEEVGLKVDKTMGKGKILDTIFGAKCEPKLIEPTFITDHPVELSPLAKRHRSQPDLVERFELICNGKELCNGFSELNDPQEQRKRFEAQQQLAKAGDQEAMVLDEPFLKALSYGMPPTVGLGIGIDRLTMLMTNASSIQEVLFFPQMRPKKS